MIYALQVIYALQATYGIAVVVFGRNLAALGGRVRAIFTSKQESKPRLRLKY